MPYAPQRSEQKAYKYTDLNRVQFSLTEEDDIRNGGEYKAIRFIYSI